MSQHEFARACRIPLATLKIGSKAAASPTRPICESSPNASRGGRGFGIRRNALRFSALHLLAFLIPIPKVYRVHSSRMNSFTPPKAAAPRRKTTKRL
jgi:hypothetical protein